MMARQVDYISAMVYPSHWGPGEYEVDDPNSQPYDIVRRSLEDFEQKVKGTGARLVPWLQDFSLGVTYGPAEVAAQIRGSRDAGVNEFLLWDPEVTYTAAGVPTGSPHAGARDGEAHPSSRVGAGPDPPAGRAERRRVHDVDRKPDPGRREGERARARARADVPPGHRRPDERVRPHVRRVPGDAPAPVGGRLRAR